MRAACWVLGLAALGCSDSSGTEPNAVPGSSPGARAAADARLDLVRRAVQAFPDATARLPACAPTEGVRVLSLPSADVLTGGKGRADVPGFARPRADASPFEDLTRNDAADRGVRNLEKLGALALFATNRIDAPRVEGQVIASAGRIDGRVVLFDLEAKPTCMSPISVVGTPITKSLVRTDANAAGVDRKMTLDHEVALLNMLTAAIDAKVKAR